MKFKVNPKERFYFSLMVGINLPLLLAGLVLLFANPVVALSLLTLAVFGVFISSIVGRIAMLFFMGQLRGGTIQVTPRQFPDVFRILAQHSQELGFSRTPDMYVLEGGGILNAFVFRFARRHSIVMYADVLEIAYQEGLPAVSFIIGHELGHIRAGHLSLWKKLITIQGRLIPFLGLAYSRACEYTCDNIGFSLSPDGALSGLLILAAGKHLYKRVNVEELVTTYARQPKGAIAFAEIFSTHPALVKRIVAMFHRETIAPVVHSAAFAHRRPGMRRPQL